MNKPVDLHDLRMRAAEVSALMKLLAHPGRLLVACELMEGERTVSEIEANTGVRQPNLSRDLARMRDAGLVTPRRDAKHVHYSLTDDRIQKLVAALCDAFGPAQPRTTDPAEPKQESPS